MLLALITVYSINTRPLLNSPGDRSPHLLCLCWINWTISKTTLIVGRNKPECWDKLNMCRYQDDCMTLSRRTQRERQLQAHFQVRGGEVESENEKDKSARNMRFSTHNSLVTTREQPRVSAILFAWVPYDTFESLLSSCECCLLCVPAW